MRHGQRAVNRLSAGHGDRIVKQDFIGDVDTGRDGGAHRKRPGMVIGAVAQILEDVLGIGKGGLPDPGDTFAAHMGKGFGRTVHPVDHVMAPDPGHGTAAFGHLGRAVMRATRAEPRNTRDIRARFGDFAFLLFQPVDAFVDFRAVIETLDALCQNNRDARRGQFIHRGQNPFALFIEFADHGRADIFAPVIKLFLDLVFHHRAFFLDDDDFLKPHGKFAHIVAVEWPAHADLQHADADFCGIGFGYAKVIECLHDIKIGLAGRDDAKPCIRAVDDGFVQLVGARIGKGGIEFIFHQAMFLILWRVGPTDMEPAFGHGKIIGDDRRDAIRRDIDRGRTFNRFGDGFHRDPATGIAAHGPAVNTEIKDILHARRVQNRDLRIDKGIFGLMGQGG